MRLWKTSSVWAAIVKGLNGGLYSYALLDLLHVNYILLDYGALIPLLL